MLFKKKAIVNRQIVGFTKPGRFLFFKIKAKPIYKVVKEQVAPTAEKPKAQWARPAKQATMKRSALQMKMLANLAPALVEIGMKVTPEQYMAISMNKARIAASVILVGGIIAVFVLKLETVFALFAVAGAAAAYFVGYQMLISYPMRRTKSIGNDVEKDVLFAARDMIVSMRSGVPLFNAMATVSVGYGAASREFEKIIDRVQLGMPMDQAIDEVSEKSRSATFKKLMLQASTSIKVGSDVIGSIQEVINDVSQERVIELRRYGQRLNAIAMFYMLFGVIFPSMGIAVAAIMSTFISIFTIDNNTLIMAVLGLAFLQFVFLRMVSSSRPSFAS